MNVENISLSVAVWALAGGAWGLVNWQLNRKETGEAIDYNHLGTTVLEHAVAGFIMAVVGDEFTIENLEYYAMVAGPTIDQVVNSFVDTRSTPVIKGATPKQTAKRTRQVPDDINHEFNETMRGKSEDRNEVNRGP